MAEVLVARTVLASVSTRYRAGYHPKGTCRSARFESAASRDSQDEIAEVVTERRLSVGSVTLVLHILQAINGIIAIAGENDPKEPK